jgi:hypothetical protein
MIKFVRTLASVAALHSYYLLRRFEYLHPDKYVAEFEREIGACDDVKLRVRLESTLKAFVTARDTTPNVHKEIAGQTAVTRDNIHFALKQGVNFAKWLLKEWTANIPVQKFLDLNDELTRLETADVKTQLNFFGLGDLAPMEEN